MADAGRSNKKSPEGGFYSNPLIVDQAANIAGVDLRDKP